MKKMNTIFGVLLLLFSSFAVHADDSSSGNANGGTTVNSASGSSAENPPHHWHHPKMTDAQKACFTANGLTAPGEGPRPTERPSHEVMEKVHACLEKNGMKPHPHGPGNQDGPPPADE